MARRGLATALQAALAGFGGYGQGVIAQREREQKRAQEKKALERQEMLDVLDAQERNYTSPEQLAGAREAAAPATSRVARSAILSALSPMAPAPLPSTADIATVMETASLRQPKSAEQSITIGGKTLVRPESKQATEARERAMARAQSMFDVAQAKREKTEATEQTNRRNFDTLVALYGTKETYNPGVDYGVALEKAKSETLTPFQRQSLALQRQRLETPKPGAGTTRGPLPTVLSTAERLKGMSEKEVLALRPGGVAAATQAPLTLAESRGGFSGLLSFPVAAGMNIYARPEEQEYAQMVRAVTDAVARASEKGVLTDRDIGRFQAQTAFLPGEGDKMMLQKFSNLKAWADWLANVEQNPAATTTRLPGESEVEAAQRSSMLRQGNAGGQDNRTEDQRDWDDAVAKYGRAYVENQYGPRP